MKNSKIFNILILLTIFEMSYSSNKFLSENTPLPKNFVVITISLSDGVLAGIIYLILSILLIVFGIKLVDIIIVIETIKYSFLIIGGIIGGSIAVAADSEAVLAIFLILSIIIGIVLSIIFIKFKEKIYGFFFGFTAGISLWNLIYTCFYGISPTGVQVIIILLFFVLIAVGIYLGVKFGRIIIIYSTSFDGANDFVTAIKCFSGTFLSEIWHFFIALIIIAGLTALGIFIQGKLWGFEKEGVNVTQAIVEKALDEKELTEGVTTSQPVNDEE